MADANLGRDLLLAPGATGFGLVTSIGDLGVVEGVDNLAQALLVRLNTPAGDLTGLGHPEYGSRLAELIGQENTVSTRNLVRLFVLDAVRREPRVGSIENLVVERDLRLPDRVQVSLVVRPITADTPLNLVFSVNLDAGP